MENIQRVEIDPRDRPADGNIVCHYPIEQAAWIWIDEPAESAFQVEFRVTIELEAPCDTVIHVSADQRYELYWNGRPVGRGPDRSDLRHWAFASHKLSLEAGCHSFQALVTYLGDKAPVAQESYAPGFILAADGLESLLNTGTGAWEGRWLQGISFHQDTSAHYHVIGPGFTIDGAQYFQDAPFQPARTARKVLASPHGIVSPGQVLHPTRLPEQKSVYQAPGKVLSAQEASRAAPWSACPHTPWSACPRETLACWEGLGGSGEVAVPANSEWRCLLDLENYFCGYTEMALEGGSGAEVWVEWAESLYGSAQTLVDDKGNRDEWQGKYFMGFGDRFLPDGPERVFRSLWWRSGRYLQVSVKTGAEPLVLKRLQVDETGYPADFQAGFDCSDSCIRDLIPMMIRGLECCGHEIMVDCPYYEQLSYVGDTRLQSLCWLVLGKDDRLVRRELELFDWSRHLTGFVAERYPSYPYQLSLTFSMIWVLMLGDFSFLRDDPEFVKGRLPGMRSLLDLLLELKNSDGLLERLPGWSFVDWVDDWTSGRSPGASDGSSAVLDLFFLLALQTATSLEQAHGEPELADRWKRQAGAHAEAIRQAYWDANLGLFTDLPGKDTHLSLHAQCLAVLAGLSTGETAQALLKRGMDAPSIAWPTPYFQYYLFEALAVAGMGGEILKLMDLWRGFLDKGFKTPPEKDDPTRSDCHAWGSHPLYHLYASVAGIRPAAPGMKRIRIAPAPGELRYLRAELPVGDAMLALNLDFDDDRVTGSVTLPAGVSGDLVWSGISLPLEPGQMTEVSL